MKYFLLFTFLFTLSVSNAQDTSCQKLIGLLNMEEGKKYSMRSIAKSPVNGWEGVIEIDASRNLYMYSAFNTMKKQIKIEHIFFNNKFYIRKNNEEWRLVTNEFRTQKRRDSLMQSLTEEQRQNMIPHNCQQLDDEMLNGERCFVFIVELECPIPKPQKGMKTLTNSIKSVEKQWYSERGLLKKAESKSTLDTEIKRYTTYEYDIDIPKIKEPVIKKN